MQLRHFRRSFRAHKIKEKNLRLMKSISCREWSIAILSSFMKYMNQKNSIYLVIEYLTGGELFQKISDAGSLLKLDAIVKIMKGI